VLWKVRTDPVPCLHNRDLHGLSVIQIAAVFLSAGELYLKGRYGVGADPMIEPQSQSAPAADRIPFTLGQLVVFRTVALTGSGRAAAVALSVSQPAISKSLALLEQVPALARQACRQCPSLSSWSFSAEYCALAH
jgi:hypothetical protein